MPFKDQINLKELPRHIAVIMDGNGRWAKQHGKMRTFGHQHGVAAVRDTVEGAAEIGVHYLTLYAFSTENWNRPRYEINALMDLLIKTIAKETRTLMDNNIRLQAIGDVESWSGNLLPGDSVLVYITDKKIALGLHVFFGRIVSVNNNATDDYTLNDFNSAGFLMSAEKYGCPVYPETPEIKVYPNPSADNITIRTSYKEEQKVTLSIYNTIGKKVYAVEYEFSTGEILQANISGLAEGIYFAEVKTFDKSTSAKFVVLHK